MSSGSECLVSLTPKGICLSPVPHPFSLLYGRTKADVLVNRYSDPCCLLAMQMGTNHRVPPRVLTSLSLWDLIMEVLTNKSTNQSSIQEVA